MVNMPRVREQRRLVVISEAGSRGGAEEAAYRIAKESLRRGSRVTYIGPKGRDSTGLVEDYVTAGARYRRLPELPGGRVTGLVARAILTVALLVRERPTAVLVNLPWPTMSLGILLGCAVRGTPTAVVFHCVPPGLSYAGRSRRVYRWLATRRQRWICVSNGTRHILAGALDIPQQRISVLPNGIDIPHSVRTQDEAAALRRSLGWQPDCPVFLTVGRLDSAKGYPELLSAIRVVAQTHPHARFVWAGDGPCRSELEDRVKQWDLGGNVTLLGYRTDVRRLLRAADFFVFPSHFEAHPLAVLEAMAEGIPILASDIPGVTGILRSGVDAELFPPESVADLQASLLLVLEGGADMKAKADCARETVKQYDGETRYAAFVDFLESIER